jgi:hypothetical protein
MKKILDRHALYLVSVQDPLSEVERISKLYSELFHKDALSLREDFAGTFALSCCWVQSDEKRSAIAIELDRSILDYGEKNYWVNLEDDQKKRLCFYHKNSISTSAPVDICVAFNFSYCLLHQRSELVEYFKKVYESLNREGILILDAFGGSESEVENVEQRVIDNSDYLAPFTFEFVLERFNPVNRMANYYINFHYHDGVSLERAFEYHFRMWSLPELSDALREAGFSDVKIFWEQCDSEGLGNGEFLFTREEENTIHWNAYVVGIK